MWGGWVRVSAYEEECPWDFVVSVRQMVDEVEHDR